MYIFRRRPCVIRGWCRADIYYQHGDVLSDNTPSTSSLSLAPMTPQRMESPGINGTPLKLARPFLHPTVSRLRSYTPQASRAPSDASGATLYSQVIDATSPSPSHFSDMSRMSSQSNLHAKSSAGQDTPAGHASHSEREVFKWTELRNITHHLYSAASQKASSVLGAPTLGSPMVLAANGLICVGTNEGKIAIYDFKQILKCVCGNETLCMPCVSRSLVCLSDKLHYRSQNCRSCDCSCFVARPHVCRVRTYNWLYPTFRSKKSTFPSTVCTADYLGRCGIGS